MLGALRGGIAATFVVPLHTQAVVAANAKRFAAQLRKSGHTSPCVL